MENATLKYIQWINRCECIECIFFCVASVFTFFVGYIKVKVWKWAATHKITLHYMDFKLLHLFVLVSSIRIINFIEIGQWNTQISTFF